MRIHLTFVTLLLYLGVVAPVAVGAQGRGLAQPPAGRGQRPPRDAARAADPVGTATITGRVIAADTARPVKRVRVAVAGAGRPRTAVTDESGRYRVTALPAGIYTITASKTGFIDSAFGQRRTLRAGTPIQLADGQQLANVDLALARGAVIAGRVLDEDGEPIARASVQVLRYQYQRGEKRLAPAGADQTDDRGQYRIFGLPAGEYVVTATAGSFEGVLRRLMNPGAGADTESTDTTGYAPTYYPGVITAAEAAPVKVGAAQEMTGIDFQLQIVPLATVRGTTTDPRGLVALVPEDAAGVRMQQLRGTVQADGTFVIANVPPGKYVAVARTEGGIGTSSIAMQPVAVAGADMTIALTPVKGAQVGGTVTFESAGTPPQTFAGFRVTAQPLGAALFAPRMNRPAEVDAKGHFTLTDLAPGLYAIQAGGGRGWTMKAVYLDGREVTDQPIEIKGGESAGGLNILFTDRLSSVAGAVRGDRDAPVAGITVIAFPSDEKLWRPQTRRIQTARTDPNGAYRLNNVPPGEYLLVATDDVEPGEWFDPAYLESVRAKGVRVTVGEGEQKIQDLKGS